MSRNKRKKNTDFEVIQCSDECDSFDPHHEVFVIDDVPSSSQVSEVVNVGASPVANSIQNFSPIPEVFVVEDSSSPKSHRSRTTSRMRDVFEVVAQTADHLPTTACNRCTYLTSSQYCEMCGDAILTNNVKNRNDSLRNSLGYRSNARNRNDNTVNPLERMLQQLGYQGMFQNLLTEHNQYRMEPLVESRINRSRPRKRKHEEMKEPEPSAMEKGKSKLNSVLTEWEIINLQYPKINALARTNFLKHLFPDISQTKLNRYRVNFEKTSLDKKLPNYPLWGLVEYVCSIVVEECKNENKVIGNLATPDLPSEPNKKINSALSPPGPSNSNMNITGSIPLITPETMKIFQKYVHLFLKKYNFEYYMESIHAIEEQATNSQGDESSKKFEDGIDCQICFDKYSIEDCVPCGSDNGIHFFCKPCFSSYITQTVADKAGSTLNSVQCPSCPAFFNVYDVRNNISEWDAAKFDNREETRNKKVALAAKAVLYCECGNVAVISEEDFGNGLIVCPGHDDISCNKTYCCNCGNENHGKDPCPPARETVEWINKHAKKCPNCGTAIEKNGGCDHMSCQGSQGCGHQFWWSCLCPYPKHSNSCQRPGERYM